METFATFILVIVDDWYIANARRYLSGKVGEKPTFTDSEVMTLMLLTVVGLASRIIAKLTAYTFRHYLFRVHGVDVLNFQFAYPLVA